MHLKGDAEGLFKAIIKMKASQNKEGATYMYLLRQQQEYERNPSQKTFSFTSIQFIQKILIAIKTFILKSITRTINEECGGKFAIQLDTTTDRSTLQQLSVVIRYVTGKLVIKERIITFLSIKKTSGKEIYTFVKQQLEFVGLNIKNAVASCTDGASNMVSEINGFTGLLQKLNSRHISTWCVCHRFNLAIEAAFKECETIAKLVASINTFSGFVRASPNRMNDWRNIINKLSQFRDVDKRTKPPQTNVTRWWSKYKAVRTIINSTSSFMAFYLSLANLNEVKKSLKWKTKQIESITRLHSLWNESASNIGILYGLNTILERLHATMCYLQTSGLPMCDVQPSITSCYGYLQELLNDKDGRMTNIIENSALFCERLVSDRFNTEKCQQLFTRKQQAGSAAFAPNDGSHFLMDTINMDIIRTELNKLLHALLRELDERFMNDFGDVHNSSYFNEMSTISPSEVIKKNYGDDNSQLSLKRLCWHAKLNSNETEVEFITFAKEFKCWVEEKQKLISTNENATCNVGGAHIDDDDNEEEDNEDEHAMNTHQRRRLEWALLNEFFFEEHNQVKYINVHALYQFIFILPTAQVGCERSFSIMKNIKTHNRSSLCDINLETYMIVNTATDLLAETSFPDIVDEVAQMAQHLKHKLLL